MLGMDDASTDSFLDVKFAADIDGLLIFISKFDNKL